MILRPGVRPSERTWYWPERGWCALPMMLAVALIGTLWLRYSGHWADSDTAVLTRAARGILVQGTVAPTGGVAYTNGFSYPVLLAFLADMSGLSVQTLQMTVLPWMFVGTALVAFVTYRAILGSARGGALCALMLLIQPDFLFVNDRGSHEKVTWVLVLVLVYALIRSFQSQQVVRVVPFIIVFYLCGFGIICSNVYFASSFLQIILVSLLAAAVLARHLLPDPRARRLLQRLSYGFVTLLILTYLVLFYLYPPAKTLFQTLQQTFEKIASLFLNVTQSESPYATIGLSWVNLWIYLAVSAYTWLLIAAAASAWVVLAVRLFRRGTAPHEIPLFLTWCFAAATAMQIAASVVSDLAGSLGSNLQLRIFPAFTLFAIPVVVTALPKRWPCALRRLPRPLLTAAIAGVFVYFTYAAVLKASNDPLISNKWIFYTQSEARLLQWGNTHLSGRRVWSEFDERLQTTETMLRPDRVTDEPQARWVAGMNNVDPAVRYFAASNVITARADRINQSISTSSRDDILYDNGDTQIFHRVPETPYQP